MPYLTHPSGQKTWYFDDDFTDPWVDSEVILIHHGWGRTSNMWYGWVPSLSRKYRVIRRDALGHGYSSAAPPGHPLTIDALLDEIVDTLDQLKIQKVHYLGESTGGIFGDFFAARHPERLHSLTICSSPLYLPKAAADSLSFGYPDPITAIKELGGPGIRGWGEQAAKVLKTDQEAPPGYMDWWLSQFELPTAQGDCDYASIILGEAFDANRIIDQIKVPMLLLAPEDSSLVPLDDQKRLAKTVKGAQLEIIPSHGHEIYLNQIELCQEKFLKFLANVEGRKG